MLIAQYCNVKHVLRLIPLCVQSLRQFWSNIKNKIVKKNLFLFIFLFLISVFVFNFSNGNFDPRLGFSLFLFYFIFSILILFLILLLFLILFCVSLFSLFFIFTYFDLHLFGFSLWKLWATIDLFKFLCTLSLEATLSLSSALSCLTFNSYFLKSLVIFNNWIIITLSWRRSPSYRNQSIDWQRKSMDWFLYDRDLDHERVDEWNSFLCNMYNLRYLQ